jgi:hypothetical protein
MNEKHTRCPANSSVLSVLRLRLRSTIALTGLWRGASCTKKCDEGLPYFRELDERIIAASGRNRERHPAEIEMMLCFIIEASFDGAIV